MRDNTTADAYASSVKVKVFLKDDKEVEMEKLMTLASRGIKDTDDDDDDFGAEELAARQEAGRLSANNRKLSSSCKCV